MTEAGVIARMAISDTLNRYVMAVDEGRYEDVVDCFTEDSVFQLSASGPPTKREDVAKTLELGRSRLRGDQPGMFQRHNLTSSVVEFISDVEATARSYVAVVTELGFDHTAIYIDRFAKTGDRWLIKERAGQIDYMRPDSRFAFFVETARAEQKD